MTLNLKIEIIKIFSLEFSLSSDKILKKKEEDSAKKDNTDKPATSK